MSARLFLSCLVSRGRLLAGVLGLVAGISVLGAESKPTGKAKPWAIDFNRDIRPLLSDRCFRCHGPDSASRKGHLRLDRAEDAYAERKDGSRAIVPGHPEKSLVCDRIFEKDEEQRMPPPDSHLTLTEGERDTLKRWIAGGAVYQPHWAFIAPPEKVAVPEVKDRGWPRNEIDRFILVKLEAQKIKPSPPADKTRWLRRVTYDLTGLPPTPGEVKDFVADKAAKSFEQVVDRLLASPRYGERMAVPWLDAARYADSYGYQSDQLCPTWPFRDWVVGAFNRNLPYDQFLTEQLAGDLLPGATRQQRLATAFNRLHRQTNEGGSIEEEWRNEYVSDRVHTFSTAMLGLTFECARCHDHKFDPLLQRDYYGLSAFFNNIDEYGLYNDSARVPTPALLLPNAAQENAMTAAESELKARREDWVKATKEAGVDFRAWLGRLGTNAAEMEIPGLRAKFTFDQLTSARELVNEVNATNSSTGVQGNKLVAGRSGQALEFNGDDEVTMPQHEGSYQPWDQYSVVFWLRLPAALTNGVIFHRTAGTDVGFHGTELSLQDGHLFFAIERFWPGNALATRSETAVPTEAWVQVAVTYDGSGDARGMRLYVDGKSAREEAVRNQLTKSPQNGGSGLSFGARFRSLGLKGGAMDDLALYDRPLAAVEIAQLFDGKALTTAVSQKDEAALGAYYEAAVSESMAKARRERAQALKKYLQASNPVQETSVMAEMATPRPTYVLARGRYDAPKTEEQRVGRITPRVLPGFPAGAPTNRLGLAKWLTDPRHPLTARVAVNRFWQMIFGRGIVSTAENFGAQGAAPTHPELLDWLARDFIKSGWDVKGLMKKMVLSATYRQDSVLRADLRESDPENLLLARGPSQRLPAEMIRDIALAASGLLDTEMGGPPVSPYMPGDLWRESNTMSPAYHQSVGGALYRRSLYTVWKRTAPMPNMAAFDAPSREVCIVRRSNTGTPQQGFVLLNDAQFVEAARVLAEKALKSGGEKLDDRIRYAFERLTAREPDRQELRILEDLFDEQKAIFEKEPERVTTLLKVGDHKSDPALSPLEVAATTMVTQAIMNLDATVWKR